MKSIQKIMVPLDFSDHQFRGIQVANQLAKKFNAKIDVVYFLIPDMSEVTFHPKEAVLLESNEKFRKEFSKVEKEAGQKLKAIVGGMVDEELQGDSYVVYSNLEESIEKIFSKIQPDLVVVGNDGTENSFSDNTLNYFLQESVPVFSTSMADLTVENILIPTDLSSLLPEQIYDIAEFMSRVYGAQIHLGNVITTDLISEAKVYTQLDALGKFKGLTSYSTHVLRDRDEMEGIAKLANKTNADLVLMKTYPKSNFWAFFNGSLARSAVKELSQAVLVEQLK